MKREIRLVGDWHLATRDLAERLRAAGTVVALYEQMPLRVQSVYADHPLEQGIVFEHPNCKHVLATERDLYLRPRANGRVVRECRACKREKNHGPTAEQRRQERLAAWRQKSPPQG